MAESYPADPDGSRPLPPELPTPPPERWQISLATLMLFTLACAVAAALARLWRFGPAMQLGSLGLSILLLLYLFWRLRIVALRLGRWKQLQQHRRELAEWAERQRKSVGNGDGKQSDPARGEGL